MIDYEKSAKLNNMTIDKLKARFEKYPKSSKRIITICDRCGLERNIVFNQYSHLCHKCAMKQPEYRESARLRGIKQMEDPTIRKNHSDFMKQYYIDNPEAKISRSKNLIEYWSDQANRDDQSERLKQFYIDHPEARDEMSKRRIAYLSIQINRDIISEKLKQYYIDHPEAKEIASNRMIEYLKTHPEVVEEKIGMFREYWANQHNRNRMSEIIRNSNSHKASVEIMRGGMDIVEHHYLYDHSDLSKNTVKMTRSDHSRLHWLLWRLGVDVPHINM